jgi:hypothetical protein
MVTALLRKATAIPVRDPKSWETDGLFLRELVVGTPCANRAQKRGSGACLGKQLTGAELGDKALDQ